MIQLQAPLLGEKGTKNVLLINLTEAKLLLFGNLEPLVRVPLFLLGSQKNSVAYHSPLFCPLASLYLAIKAFN